MGIVGLFDHQIERPGISMFDVRLVVSKCMLLGTHMPGLTTAAKSTCSAARP